MSASTVAARGNTIFPVESFGDTLIVLPKGDKAGFGEADFRVECSRVAAALRDPLYKNLVLDFSLTNYVGGNVVEELQKWVAQVREDGGRAVACEVSDDMRKGLEVSRRADDWEFFDTCDDALKAVARETPRQTLVRWAPTIATVATVALLIGLGAWLLTGRQAERRRYVALEEIWRDYAKLRKRYPDVQDQAAQTKPLVERLDGEIELISGMLPSQYATRNSLLAVAKGRMKPVLLEPRSPDPRAEGVEAGLAYIRANLAGVPKEEFAKHQARYIATRPRSPSGQAGVADAADRSGESASSEERRESPREGASTPPEPQSELAAPEPEPMVSGASAASDDDANADADNEAVESTYDPDRRLIPVASGRSPE